VRSDLAAGPTFDAVFRDRLRREPDAPFVRFGQTWFTLAELDERSDRLAAGLARLGIGQGDHVAWMMSNRVETVEILLAVSKLAAVQVPLNYWLKGRLLEYQLQDCGAAALIVDGPAHQATAGLLDQASIASVVHVDDPPPGTIPYGDLTSGTGLTTAAGLRSGAGTEPSTLLAILYTSGTTAAAKGCMLSSGYYVSVARAFGDHSWVMPGDRLYSAFAMFHTSGQLLSFTSALVNGASIAFAAEFHASSFMSEAAAAGATMLIGVGTMANLILAQPPTPEDSARGFRLAFFAPLPPGAQQQFERRFGTPVTAEAYGQTECVPVTISPLDRRKRETAGLVSPLLEVRVVDDSDREVEAGLPGEIVVRPRVPHVMYSGYWAKAEETVATWRNLWHHTGDVGRLDSEGYLTFVDRKKDVIRRRGENISSVAIEEAVRGIAAVQDVAVCAVPAELGDDEAKACVVLAAGASLTPREFFDYLRDHLPYYAIPRYVEIRDGLPVNSIGRVMKHELKQEGVPAGAWDLVAAGLVVPRHDRRGTTS
jgi:crotonobetaine/carnitine-CoA ligase